MAKFIPHSRATALQTQAIRGQVGPVLPSPHVPWFPSVHFLPAFPSTLLQSVPSAGTPLLTAVSWPAPSLTLTRKWMEKQPAFPRGGHTSSRGRGPWAECSFALPTCSSSEQTKRCREGCPHLTDEDMGSVRSHPHPWPSSFTVPAALVTQSREGRWTRAEPQGP